MKNKFMQKIKEKEDKIMWHLKSKYSSEKIEKLEKTMRNICSFLIFVNLCTVMLHIEVFASNTQKLFEDDVLEVKISSESDINTIDEENVVSQDEKSEENVISQSEKSEETQDAKNDINTTDENKVTVDSINSFAEEVSTLSSDDNLEANTNYQTKRLLVQSDTSDFDNYGAESIINYGNLYVLQFKTENETEKAYNNLKNSKVIKSVEIDSVLETGEGEENNSTQKSEKETETELSKHLSGLNASKEIKVAILDTGIDLNNNQYKNRIIDIGLNLSTTGEANSIKDDNGHGTEMATIIGENSNDNVKLMPIKVANSKGKTTILNTYIGMQKAIENGANVINISMNALVSTTSHMLTDIINEANNKGIIVVVSAGNDSIDVKNVVPSNMENAIVVSAINNDNSFANYSNYGETVDYSSYGTYNNKTGTSYATSNVSGIIANLLSKNEDISILDKYAIDLGTQGKDNYFGKGFIGLINYNAETTEENENSSEDKIPDDYYKSTIFEDKDWKTLSDEELDEYLYSCKDIYLAVFLQNLSQEDLELILSKDTRLKNERVTYETNEDGEAEETSRVINYQYLLNLDISEMSISENESKTGQFYLTIRRKGSDKNLSKVKVNVTVGDIVKTTTYDGKEYYQYKFSTSYDTNNTDNNHNIEIVPDGDGVTQHGRVTTKSKGYENETYVENNTTYYKERQYNVFCFNVSWEQEANTYIDSVETEKRSSNRFTTQKYNWQLTGGLSLERGKQTAVTGDKPRQIKDMIIQATAEQLGIDGMQDSSGTINLGVAVSKMHIITDYNTYKITLNNQGATKSGTTSYYEKYNTGTYSDSALQQSIKKITVPEKTGYIFEGYYTGENGTGERMIEKDGTIPGNTTFTSDTTLYAKWTPIQYIVRYNGNGNTGGTTADSTHTYDVAKNLTTNGYERKYRVTYNYQVSGIGDRSSIATYTFKNWNTNANGTGTTYTNGQSVKNLSSTQNNIVNLYAQWNPGTVTLNEASRAGYRFDGWYTAQTGGTRVGGANDSYTPTAHTILYAHWTPIQYTVRYHGNGNTGGTTDDSTHTYNVAKNLTTNGYTREYRVTYNYQVSGIGDRSSIATYPFKNWNTDEYGKGTTYENGQSVTNLSSTQGSDVHLYAQWNPGTVTLNEASRTGYNFKGWYTAPTGGELVGEANDIYTPTENITLYAQWEPWTLKVNIDKQDSETHNTISSPTTFKIYEYNNSTETYDKEIDEMVQQSDKTYIHNKIQYLTYSNTNLGEFRIIEEKAPEGYYGDWTDSTETQKVYHDINIEEIIRTGNYNGQKVSDKETIKITIENERVKGKVNVNIIDEETQGKAQGDATLEGATYGIYAAENIVYGDGKTGILYNAGTLIQRATIENLQLVYDNLELGEYYIQQITPSKGYTKTDTKYHISITYEGEKVEKVEKNVTVEEKVKKQAFQLIKVGNVGNNDEFEALENVGFKVYLVSNLTKVKNGEIVKNENGNYNAEDFENYEFSQENTALDYTNSTEGENIQEIFTNKDGYLLSPELAYGTYIVVETTVPEERYAIKPFITEMEEDNRTPKNLGVFNDKEFAAKIQITKKDTTTNKTVLKANAKYRILNLKTNEYVEQWITYPSKRLIGTEENPYTTDETGTVTTALTLSAGEYELQEVTAPQGYVLVGNEGISEQGKYTATPSSYPKFKISKTMVLEYDTNTEEPIVKVEQYNNQQLGSLTVDVKGETLSGYTTAENGNYTFEYEERKIEGAEFALYAKYNIYSQDNQSDIVYNKDEKIATITSDSEGKCIVDNLPIGIYYIKQTKTPEGFVLNKIEKEIEIAYGGQETAVVYKNESYKDERQKLEVSLTNKDAETEENLTGGKFGIYSKEKITYINKNGEEETIEKDTLIYEIETDENGIANWNAKENVDLPLGKYYIKQITAPEGYVTSGEIIEIDGTYKGQDKEKIEIKTEFKNQPSKIVIRKQDEETKNGLSEVEMRLLNSKGEELYRWTTDETGEKEIRKLPLGETYTLQETKTKENYEKDMIIDLKETEGNTNENPNNITKNENTEITFVVNNTAETQNIVIGNISKVGNIEIIKTGEVLVGTEENEEGNIEFKYENQKLPEAEYEVYTKENITHPDGKTGIIIVAGTKIATATTTEEGTLVTKVSEEIKENSTEEVKKLLERGIPLGEYQIKETKAPKGYYRDEENCTKEINIKGTEENEKITKETITFENARQKVVSNETDETDETGEIKEKTGIYKYDEETKEPLSGAVIGIYASEDIIEKGNVIVKKDTLIQKGTTNENGRIRVYDLPLGKYYIQEIEAPKGYEYKEDKIEVDFSSLEENKEKVEIYVELNNRKTEINILKTDVEKNPITGAKLELQDEQGNAIEAWETTEEAYNIRGIETEKIYKIHEKEVAKGYVTEEDKQISLDKYGKIITDEENIYDEKTIMMKDEKTKIHITVIDEKTEEELEDIHIQIIDKDTQEIVYEYDIKDDTKELIIEGLPIGEYEVIQTTDKDGYVTTKNTITIDDNKGVQEKTLIQKITKLFIKVKDTEEEKYIEASKIDIKDKETGKVIASTEDGSLKIEKVEGGYLVERLPIQEYELDVKPLEGYKDIEERNITIQDTEELQEAEVETRKLILDMKVEKYLNGIRINNEKQNINKTAINKIEVHRKKVESVDIEIEYIIKVTNVGEIAGTIENIIDELPENMEYLPAKSDSSWKVEGNKLISTEYAKKELEVGASKEYKIVVKWKNGKNNFGTKVNTAKIAGVSNKLNYSDNNQGDNESKVTTLMSIATGSNTQMVIEIVVTLLIAIIVIGSLVIVEIKILTK